MHILPFSSSILYVVFLVPLCPVYCNTLLANLNARVYIGNRGETTDYFTTSSLPAPGTARPGGVGLVFSPQAVSFFTIQAGTVVIN